MFLERLARPGPAKAAGRRLYGAVVAQARRPALYARCGAPDTPDGRFELYTLHVLMVLERLRNGGAKAAAVSQALFDAYLSGLDHGLRELAVGDLSVGRTMRKLGEAFYGRAKAWDEALAALPDRAALDGLIERTVFGGVGGPGPALLADYVLAARQRLSGTDLEAVMEARIDWPDTA